MTITEQEILSLETRFRANLINSLGGFKSLTLVGTKSTQGNENLCPFSSLFHIGANPAICGVIIRPGMPDQNTLGNIINTKSYTLNHVNPDIFEQAHQASAKYDHGQSEFEHVGLSIEYSENIYAPFVAESRVKFACELVQKIDLEINGTFLILGKIVKVIIPDTILKDDGYLDLEAAQTVTCSGLDSYHTTQRLARLSYAKIGKPLNKIV